MTEKEKFQRAFAPLHASPDTMTEVMKMTERKTKRPALRRAATIGLAAALVLALGSVAYASDLGGIQRTVQLWLNGEMTDATLTVNEGSYTLRYPDKDGTEHEMGGGGIAIEDDGTERALTEEEMLEHLNAPEVEEREDGTVTVYYLDQKLDVTDKFDEDAQRVAYNRALAAAKKALTQETVTFIKETFGDLDSYLKPMIESQVRSQKVYM